MSAQLEHVHLLMRKAQSDLVSGEDILAAGHVVDSVCFHAQQAVEKSLKALLALSETEYPRTHDLRKLLDLVVPLFGPVGPAEEEVIQLSVFAVDIRYDDTDEPDADTAAALLELARRVHSFAEDVIAREARDEGSDTDGQHTDPATPPSG